MNFNYAGIYYTYRGKLAEDFEELTIYNNSSSLYVSDILLGRLSNKIAGSNAYIVDLGEYGKGFLSANNAKSIFHSELKLGENYLFQVTQLERGRKLPKLRADFSINSENFVILTDSLKTVYSSKITDTHFKKRLNAVVNDVVSGACGVLVRTSAYDVDLEDLERELISLYEKYDLIVASKNRILKDNLLCRSFNIDTTQDNLSLINDRVLRNRLSSILSKKNLSLGKFEVTIDQLEALVAVDVDTTSYDEEYRTSEEFKYQVNKQILPQILKELYIRNCSGIILIDLLKMSNYNRKKFMAKLKDDANYYRAMNFDIKGFTRLGLLEMSRRRTNPSIRELIVQDNISNGFNFGSELDMLSLEIISASENGKHLLSIPYCYKEQFIRDRKIIREYFKNNASKVYFRFVKASEMSLDYTNSIFDESYGELTRV